MKLRCSQLLVQISYQIAVPFLLSVLGAFPSYAQVAGGSIVGVVSDASGAVLPKASVKAINAGTNQTSETTTNPEGYYEFPILVPGPYNIEVAASGMQSQKSAVFDLYTGTRPRLDFSLNVGNVAEAISVSATAPLVNVTTTDLGQVIDQQKIAQLPLNGRNYLQLITLQAGAASGAGAAGRGGFSFNGSPGLGNNLLMDGVDMSFGELQAPGSDIGAGASGATFINTISVEAVQEYKASTSAYSAEFGGATGGVINVTTKSGTNQFHGTAFDFFRNDKLDANGYENNRRNVPRAPLRFNQFGGNFGGPIIKNKLFFFFNYEGVQAKRATNVSGNIPTPALLALVTPAIRKHLDELPKECSNAIPGTDLVCFHFRSDQRTNNENTFIGRTDYQWYDHRTSVRYNYNNQDFAQPNTVKRTNQQVFPTRFHNTALQDIWNITPTLLNEFRIGFNRVDLNRNNTTFASSNPPGWVEVAGATSFVGDFQSQLYFITNTYSLNDNMTKIFGKHTVKFGVDLRRVQSYRYQNTNPTHYFNSVADLIADNPSRIRLSFGNPGRGVSLLESGFFVQDDWRINRRLQLNIGLRYEYYTPGVGPYNIATDDPYGPFTKSNEPVYKADKNNFAPRLGVVFDAFGDQKLVIRTGGGINYGPPQPFYFYAMAFAGPTLPFEVSLFPTDIPASIGRAFPFPQSYLNTVAANPSLLPSNFLLVRHIFDRNRRDEYTGQWNFTIQSAITKSTAIQAAYVGSRGVNLITTRFFNLPVNGVRPKPEFSNIEYEENTGRSNYHALQLTANHRMSKRVSADFYYTLSKGTAYFAADAGDGVRQNDVQDFEHINLSTGPKVGDTRHRIIGVLLYEVPTPGFARQMAWAKAVLGGWSLQGIYNWRSGVVGNVLAARDLVGNGRTEGTRPDLVPGQPLYMNRTPQASDPGLTPFVTTVWLNRSAFDLATPTAQKRFGTASYDLIYGPNAWNLDGSVIRNFAVRERHTLQFRAEFFNTFNHSNENQPDLNAGSATFGYITGRSGVRNIQLALKYSF